MPGKTGLILFFLLLFFSVTAQEKLNFAEVDKKSYDLFVQQKWKELINYSSQARTQGIDFFYLDVRTAIAWYNQKKYRNSAEWFLKGWDNGKSFEWYQEYLYYSLLYAGRGMEAFKYATEFSETMKKKIDLTSNKMSKLAVEGGYSFNPDFSNQVNTSLKEKANTSDNYGEVFYLKNYHFESVDLSHQISPKFFLNHNFTYIGITREEQVDWVNKYTFPTSTSQFQYYLNPVFVIGRKIYASPSATFLWGKTGLNLGALDVSSQKYFYSSQLNYSDYIVSAAFWSHFGRFSPGAEFNTASISNENLAQVSAWLTIYPLSTTSLYITPRVYFKAGQGSGFGYNTIGISGGLQAGLMHFYVQYLKGDMKNFIEASGYVISNFPGRSTRKYMGSIYFPAGKKYQFVVRYINQDISEDYTVYINAVKTSSLTYSYIKHTITGGISWNF
jgi:hypothetical protein